MNNKNLPKTLAQFDGSKESTIHLDLMNSQIKARRSNQEYLDDNFKKETIAIIKDNLSELAMWSAYNNDEHIEEIAAIEKLLEQISDQEPYGINVAHEMAGGLTDPSY